jgi:hypothetical protein
VFLCVQLTLTDISVGSTLNVTIPGIATPTTLFCDLQTNDDVVNPNRPSDFIQGAFVVNDNYPTETAQVVVAVGGPVDGGSPSSYVANGDEHIETSAYISLDRGVRAEAWYKCRSQPAVPFQPTLGARRNATETSFAACLVMRDADQLDMSRSRPLSLFQPTSRTRPASSRLSSATPALSRT